MRLNIHTLISNTSDVADHSQSPADKIYNTKHSQLTAIVGIEELGPLVPLVSASSLNGSSILTCLNLDLGYARHGRHGQQEETCQKIRSTHFVVTEFQ
jgi:hypothetical protein